MSLPLERQLELSATAMAAQGKKAARCQEGETAARGAISLRRPQRSRPLGVERPETRETVFGGLSGFRHPLFNGGRRKRQREQQGGRTHHGCLNQPGCLAKERGIDCSTDDVDGRERARKKRKVLEVRHQLLLF